MKGRRPLIEGLKKPVAIDPSVEKSFVFPTKPAAAPEPTPPATNPRSTPIARSPISTRIRSDFATALKRASLERQLQGVEPNTLQDFLEEAIEPWLKQHGYLP